MPQVVATPNTCTNHDNVLALNLPPDKYMTAFMLEQVELEVATRLPSAMCTVSMIYHDQHGIRQDHVLLERIGGSLGKSYQIWRGGRAGFSVAVKGEPDDGLVVINIGPFQILPDAVQAVLDHITMRLAA